MSLFMYVVSLELLCGFAKDKDMSKARSRVVRTLLGLAGACYAVCMDRVGL